MNSKLIKSLVAGAAMMFTYAAQADTEMSDGYTWEYELVNGKTAKIVGVDWFVPGPVTIPAKLGGKNVTEIGPEVFKGKTFAVVTIPSTVTEIYERAFSGCKNLRAVKIPDAVTAIGASAFEGCESLVCVDLGKKVGVIGEKAFKGCSALEALVFRGNAPTAVFADAFSGVSAGGVFVSKSAKNWPAAGELWYGLPVTVGDKLVKVAATSSDEACGTVSGGGDFAVGKKVTLKAKANKGCVFGGWTEYGSTEVVSYSTSFAYTVDGYHNGEDPLFTARFKKVDEEFTDPLLMELPWKVTAWDFYLDLEMLGGHVVSFSEPKLKFKGLPSGIKYDAKTFKLSGLATKPGEYTVEVTASNASKNSASDSFIIVVPNFTDDEIDVAPSYGPFIPGAEVLVTVDAAAGCKVTGLPSGLKWTDKDITDKTYGAIPANSFYGAVTKPGSYTVYFTKTVDKVKHTATATVKIDKLRELEIETFGTGTGKASGDGAYPAYKMVTLKAKADGKNVFSGWYRGSKDEKNLLSRSANYSYEMGTSEKTKIYAKFITQEEDAANVQTTICMGDHEQLLLEGETSQFEVRCGVYVMWELDVEALSDTTEKFAGLPAGLKFTAKPIFDKTFGPIPAYTIYGCPTTPSKLVKQGELLVPTPSRVKLTVTTAGKAKVEYNLEFLVTARAAWATGSYSGGNENGQATISITEAGKVTGKWIQYNGTYTLSAPGFSDYDEDKNIYHLYIAVKDSDILIPAELIEGGVIVFTNGTGADLYRNTDWKSETWKPIATKFAKAAALTFDEYDVHEEGDKCSFSLKFAATGSVTVKCNYFAPGATKPYSVSGSAVLIATTDPGKDTGYFEGFVHVGLQEKAGKFLGLFERIAVYWNGTKFGRLLE